jgi:uncharacterized protein YgiM (DUF1202 family)
MAVARFKVPKLEKKTFRGWTFVVFAGVVLALVAIIDRGGLDELRTGADGSTGCQLEVAADELNVRTEPSADSTLVQTLVRGDRVDGTRIITNGFRQLEGNRWAASQFLTPLPGTNCA